MRWLLLGAIVCGGCLSSDTPDDGSANLMDMGGALPDLENADLYGLLLCPALNAAEKMCMPNNNMCVTGLRMKATPEAVVLDTALQSCFQTYCPSSNGTDMLSICTPIPDGMGGLKYSDPCVACVNNTLQSQGSNCNPPSAPECTKCYNDALACENDTT
jgi:hypothetical protein